MSNVNKIKQIAEQLAKDLNKQGLDNYLAFNKAKVENEIRLGRNPGIYNIYLEAAKLALNISNKKE